MSEPRCNFCNKALSAEKLETEYGCLDCAGWIYLNSEKGEYYCAHCIEKENTELKAKLGKAVEALKITACAAEFYMSHADCRRDSWSCRCSFCRPNDHSKNIRKARQALKEIEQ